MAVSFCAAIGLSACNGLAPGLLASAPPIDPLSADAAAIRLAVEAPRGLAFQPGDVTLLIAVDGTDGTRLLEERFEATIDSDHTTLPGITLRDPGARKLVVTAIAEGDHARLREAQERARALKAEEPRRAGTLAVNATGCRASAIPGNRVIVSTYIQTEPGAAFRPLTRDFDLGKAFAAAGQAEIPDCSIRALASD